jgi:hypothetical protein
MPTDFIKFNTDGKISLVTPARWFKLRTPNRASELALKNPPSGPVPWLASHRDGRTCTVVAPRDGSSRVTSQPSSFGAQRKILKSSWSQRS